MLKVNNKKVIQDLAKTTYKANKKRNLLTIVAIFLTTFLLCTVISVGLSYWDTVSLRQRRMQGMDYDIELTEPRDDQVSTIRKMNNVRYAGISVKCGIASKYKNKELDKLKFYWLDDICWKQQTIPALDYYKGNYPAKENEIMLSQSALRSMGIENPKVGMELPFIYQTLAENSENNDTAKSFILSGWFLDYTSVDKGYVSDKFYQSTGVLQTDLTQGTLKISLKNPLYSEKDIIEMQNQINLSGNQIIEADYDTISNFIKTMMGLLILLVLVFMSGYLFIYNTLYISVNRDIRYFGQLKTIGTTSVQIRKMIYKQMLWNAMIGIPLGLVCSSIVGKIIIPQLLHSLNSTIAISEVGTISLWVFIIATIFSLTTTMISSQKPVKIAMNCSPIEAMKYIGATSIKNKNKKRTGGDIGSMVKMNLFRDKKQFVIIMCSLSLAVSLCLIINVVIYANNAKNILNHSFDYDIRLLNQTLLSDNEEQVINSDFIEQIKSIDGVKDVRVLKSATAVVPYQENVYGEYYKELYASRYSPGNYDKDIELYKKQPDHYSFTCRVVGIDEVEFEKINNTLQTSLDKEKFKNGEIFVPEMLVAARAMKKGVEVLKPHLASGSTGALGKVIIATVSGDLHDIGKNLVAMMIESAGFEVIDLGVDVPAAKIIECYKENPDVKIIALSALLTTTMPALKETVEALNAADFRGNIKVMVGGAPITEAFAEEIGADGYSDDAASAASLAKKLAA